MNREDFVKRFEDSKKRALSVELEKFEKENGESLETLVNKFLANAYSSYDTNEKLRLNVLLTKITPPGEWKQLDSNPYSSLYYMHNDKVEYKEDVIDEKKEKSIWYERAREIRTPKNYSNLHSVIKIFVKDILTQKGYFIIEKLEPAIGSGQFYRDSYKYLEVYYDEQTYKHEYKGISTDVKAMIKEVERLLIAIKEENKL